MRCPFCTFEGTRALVHSHLAACHEEAVKAWADAETGRMYYAIRCPICQAQFQRVIKPRWSDPTFIEEFWPEIKLIAFDQLLHHYSGSHLTWEGANTTDDRS